MCYKTEQLSFLVTFAVMIIIIIILQCTRLIQYLLFASASWFWFRELLRNLLHWFIHPRNNIITVYLLHYLS